MKKKLSLSDHFTYYKLIRFVMPSIIMMIFTSVYGIVDGLFVSNFVGKTSFAAINLIFPALNIIGAVGFMLGSGGTAFVGKTLGEGKREMANRYFSMLICAGAVIGAALAAVGFVLLPSVAAALGAGEGMKSDCVVYGRIILAAMPFFILQNMFQSFFIAAEKPKLGLLVTVAAGVTNMALDALFVAVFKWGVSGAALATGISQFVGAAIPLAYFLGKNSSLLRITKTKLYTKVLLKSCANGSSEMVTNLAMSFMNMLINWQLMRLAGENGVASYGVIMYASFIFSAIFYGYAIGSAPVISYHFGAGNKDELKNLLKKSMVITTVVGILITAAVLLFSAPLSRVFVGYDKELCDMTVHAFRVFLIGYFCSGFTIFGSAFFTALNNGIVSAVISFTRTLLFEGGTILIFPFIWGLDGVWWAFVASDSAAMLMTLAFIFVKRKQYGYM